MRCAIATFLLVVAVIGQLLLPPPLLLVWNTTASMPTGLYRIQRASPKRGDLLVTRLSREMELVAVSRGILAPTTPVLKPVAAIAGDRVCRVGSAVYVNGRFAALARELDRRGQHMPVWRGCRRLRASQVFLLARHPQSFDSRYYGQLELHLAGGIARPLLIF